MFVRLREEKKSNCAETLRLVCYSVIHLIRSFGRSFVHTFSSLVRPSVSPYVHSYKRTKSSAGKCASSRGWKLRTVARNALSPRDDCGSAANDYRSSLTVPNPWGGGCSVPRWLQSETLSGPPESLYDQFVNVFSQSVFAALTVSSSRKFSPGQA